MANIEKAISEGKKTEKTQDINAMEAKGRECIKEGWSTLKITEEQCELRAEKYLLDLATRKMLMTLTTVFSQSGRGRGYSSGV